ncbi:MAG: recombinase family protein [Dehalococcoidia bacterium]
MESTPRVLGYVRPLVDAGISLDATVQRTALRACARGEGLGAIEIYEESAEDGRLAFAHLIEAVREWTGDDDVAPTIVVATFGALGGSTVERVSRLLLVLASGARMLFADGHTVDEALHEGWSHRDNDERRRDRVREGMRAKALRGVVLGRPPFGYAVEDRSLTPHSRESVVVQRIFREYVEQGEGLRRIAAGLNRDGIRTRLRRAWTPGSVRTILRNPVYTGLYRRLGVVVPASHPALVDRATFGATQRRMAQRRTSRPAQQRHAYIFAGLLRCGRCGAPMAGDRRHAKGSHIVHYRCASATSRGTCRAPGVREAHIESAILEELASTRSSGAVAIRSSPKRVSQAAKQRLERLLVESIERWYAGEWRLPELVAHAAPVVREMYQHEWPLDEPMIAPDEARLLLVEGWATLDVVERGRLLRAALAEIVVDGDVIQVVRRR